MPTLKEMFTQYVQRINYQLFCCWCFFFVFFFSVKSFKKYFLHFVQHISMKTVTIIIFTTHLLLHGQNYFTPMYISTDPIIRVSKYFYKNCLMGWLIPTKSLRSKALKDDSKLINNKSPYIKNFAFLISGVCVSGRAYLW